MKTKTEVIQEIAGALYALQKTDKEIGDVWKMPSPRMSMLFAITELGEYVNAYINNANEGFARNNDQKTEPEEEVKELTDVGMMLLKMLIGLIPTEITRLTAVDDAAEDFYSQGQRYTPLTWVGDNLDDYSTPEMITVQMAELVFVSNLEQNGAQNVETVVQIVYMLIGIINNPLYKETSFLDRIKKKLAKTIVKVNSGKMKIV